MIKESDYTISESGCWIWLGKRCSGGRYGYFSMKGKMKMAHRASYETFKGDINAKLTECDVLEIRDFYDRTKCSYSALARKFGLKSQGHARAIAKRIIWKHI